MAVAASEAVSLDPAGRMLVAVACLRAEAGQNEEELW